MNPWEPRDDHYCLIPNKALLNLLIPQPQSSLSSASVNSHVPYSATCSHAQGKYKEGANTHDPPCRPAEDYKQLRDFSFKLPEALTLLLQPPWKDLQLQTSE